MTNVSLFTICIPVETTDYHSRMTIDQLIFVGQKIKGEKIKGETQRRETQRGHSPFSPPPLAATGSRVVLGRIRTRSKWDDRSEDPIRRATQSGGNVERIRTPGQAARHPRLTGREASVDARWDGRRNSDRLKGLRIWCGMPPDAMGAGFGFKSAILKKYYNLDFLI
jgi:hypothetical protein